MQLRKGKKPEKLLQRIIEMSSEEKEIIIDAFLGSGTTAAVCQKTGRKWLGIEFGEYFEEITKKRLLLVLNGEQSGVSKDNQWKGGGFFKYITLENYEDVLNNLSLNRKENQSLALKENADFREGYMLNYILDTEVKDSLLNVSAFENPFNYYLNITRQNEMSPTKVDMVETFNYLIGLVVERMDTIRGFRVVEGKDLQEERILIIWRNTKEKDNNELNNFFEKMGYSTRDQEFSRIYVNGDNNLENLKTEEDRWKVVMIEEEFKRRMFEVEDV